MTESVLTLPMETAAEVASSAAPETTRVAVIGASGYVGSELIGILKRHPHVSITGTFGSAFDLDSITGSVVFLAIPNEVSAEIAPAHPKLLTEAVYGLTEWCNGELTKARLVANPGCYPTSILLALRPLAYLLDRDQPVICDSKSGVSGAGKKSELAWSFAEVSGNFKAYSVGHHRHEPEIRHGLHLGDRTTLVFVPHLLPTVRGILSTMHIAFSRHVTAAEITDIYEEVYANAPFVRVLPAGELPEMKSVVNTPRAEIGFQLLNGGRRAVVVSVIDNLLKGAASQAVQNFNCMCGYAETEGLV